MQKYQAILHGKCPRCRKGDLFIHPAYNFTKFHKMYEKCRCCDLDFRVEPGFYFGAMYVSYAIVVAMVLIEGLVIYSLFNNPVIWVYFYTALLTVFGLLPWIFRFSRILFLHLFGGIDFDPALKIKNC